MQNNDHQHDLALERELAELKKQYEKLREDKVRTEQNLDNLNRQLGELEEQARTEYGTSDPEELTKLLNDKRAENERLVAEYREHIISINTGLSELEKGGQ
ncbi:hypothetical protein [Maridesulfovibrio bastinii]|uniref:hypothetical protein n=1 Tax=Maridesulfovibrio bastinii TaxID=47157 RepID=UPI000415E0B3|nr:hypothetical protein [Maridesulfovibrio bastinii]